jgi:hypothetical protein
MTAEEKLSYLEKQVYAVRRERTDTINCPYCKCQNRAGDETPCCETFTKAMWAVLNRMDLNHQKEIVEQAMEKASRN